MTFEEYTGKKVAIISNAGYIYNHDKTKKTLSKDIAADWYGCKKDELVCISAYQYAQTGVYLEPASDYVDENGDTLKRIKVTLWDIRNGQPVGDKDPLEIKLLDARDCIRGCYTDGRGHMRRESYEPCYYVYSNGKVSHDDCLLSSVTGYRRDWESDPILVQEYEKAEAKYLVPHKVRNVPSSCGWVWTEYAYNIVPLNNISTWRGASFEKPALDILKAAGLDKYVQRDKVYDTDSYYSLIELIRFGLFGSRKSNVKTGEEFLTEPAKKMDNIVEIEKIGKGTMIRVADEDGKEARRVFITERGTIKIMMNSKYSTGGVWLCKDLGCTSWLRDAISYANKVGKIKGEFKDLVSENPKFKYLNKWMNENMDVLMGTAEYARPRKTWDGPSWYHYSNSGSDTIIEFLRLANKYPALVETLAKLGYGDVFMDTTKITYNKRTGWAAVWDDPREITEKADVKILSVRRINDGFLGELKKGAKGIIECLGINKEQWKFITKKIEEDITNGLQKDIAVTKNFGYLQYAKKYFTGGDDWGDFNRASYRFLANELSEVPEAMFEKFYESAKYIEGHKNFLRVIENYWVTASDMTAYGKILMNSVLTSYASDYNTSEWVRGDINHDTLLKTLKKCVESEMKIGNYRDYNRLRTQCASMGIEGYNIEDWPAMPKPEYLSILHDRLSELYNAAELQKREAEETDRQKLYDERVGKLTKLEYENDEDDMAIVCPRKLVEIILEGQRLSHCVGSYTEAVAKGVETILFLRKKDAKNTSYATIDIAFNKTTKKWDIRQAHTACNGPITEHDAEFLRKWAKKKGVDEKTVTTRYGALCHLAVE